MTLPKFEGVTPNQQRYISSASHLLHEDDFAAHRRGDTVYRITEEVVQHVNHKTVKDAGCERCETAVVRRFGFLPSQVGVDLIEAHAKGAPELFDEIG